MTFSGISVRRRAIPAAVASTALLAGVFAGAGAQAKTSRVAQAAYSVPAAPTGVSARKVKGGVLVRWTAPAAGSPPVTNYVVHSGPGSCPVTTGPQSTSVVMPVAKGQTQARPEVNAVNAYGYSPSARSSRSLKVSATSSYRNVQVIQFSDFHGALETSDNNIGAAVLETAFQKDRTHSPSTFTAISGDSIGGAPPISSAFEERPTIEALNLMKADVSTFGNHEHDRKLDHLRQMIDLSNFKWTVANYSSLEPLKGKKHSTKPYVILDRGGVKVGFVGMNTPETKDLVAPGNLEYAAGKEIAIGAGVASVQKKVDAARKAGAQVVIALIHQGWSTNEAGKALGPLVTVAGQLKHVAAVYGGHTHQPYASITTGNTTVETRNSGQEYSRLQVCLNRKTGKVKGTAVQVIGKKDVAGLKPDKTTAAMVAGYQKQLGAKYDVKLGSVNGVFPRGGTPPVERSGETPMGDITADALRARYGTDFVMTNGGGIRDTLPAAGYIPNLNPPITRPPTPAAAYDVLLGDVMTVYPFNSAAATSTVTGEQLWKALENGVSKWPGDGRFPQIAGFRFSFDPNLPAQERIKSVTRLDGTPIAKDSTVYTITVVDYMAFGGDGYADFFNPTTAKIQGPFADVLIDVLKADMAAGRVTQVPALDGRITNVGAP